MTHHPEPPRMLDFDEELPRELKEGLSRLRARIASADQLARMAAALPLTGVPPPSSSAGGASQAPVNAGSVLGSAKVVLVGASLLAGTAGVGGWLWWHAHSTRTLPGGSPVSMVLAQDAGTRPAEPIASVPSRTAGVGHASGNRAGESAADGAPVAASEPSFAAPSADSVGAVKRSPIETTTASRERATISKGLAHVGSTATATSPPNAGPHSVATAAGAGVAATSPGSSAASSRRSASSEIEMLRSARAALATDPAEALRLANEHRRIYGARGLGDAFELVAISALVRMGEQASARARAARFARQYPNSLYQRQVDALVGSR